MTTLYLRLPSRASLLQPFTRQSACSFALISSERIERQGDEALEKLSPVIAAAERVVLLLAAADVTLLRLSVPPLSAAKLNAALPNLVEEYLLDDVDACVIVAAEDAGEAQRQILVVQREWLTSLAQLFTSLGARHVQALAGQLCLQARAGEVAAAITESGDITLHLSPHQGMGWLSSSLAPVDVVASLRAIAPQQAMALHVPSSSAAAYLALGAKDVTVVNDDWSHWIGGAQKIQAGSDLMLGLGSSADNSKATWQRWRWPLRIAVAAVLLNVLGLNLQWWQMANEAKALREGMNNSYRTAYPDESVVVDPIAQTRQKITLAEQAAGKVADDSFIALTARFGALWSNQLAALVSTSIETLEYRDGQLLIRLKQPLGTDIDRAQIASVFAAAHLSWSDAEAGVWKIGSRK